MFLWSLLGFVWSSAFARGNKGPNEWELGFSRSRLSNVGETSETEQQHYENGTTRKKRAKSIDREPRPTGKSIYRKKKCIPFLILSLYRKSAHTLEILFLLIVIQLNIIIADESTQTVWDARVFSDLSILTVFFFFFFQHNSRLASHRCIIKKPHISAVIISWEVIGLACEIITMMNPPSCRIQIARSFWKPAIV